VGNSTKSFHSLQRSKSSINIITNQLSIKGSHVKQVNLRYYRSLHIKGKDLKIFFQLRKQVVREDSKRLSNQGVKMRTKTFKISNKVETNSKDRDIIWMKIPRIIEQVCYNNFKTL